jgi:hypothetical protein
MTPGSMQTFANATILAFENVRSSRGGRQSQNGLKDSRSLYAN